MDGVFYAFDNKWYEKHYLALFFLRFGVAAVVFFLLAIAMVTAGYRGDSGGDIVE